MPELLENNEALPPRPRDVAKDLALKGLSAHEIRRELQKQFETGIPDVAALEGVIREVDAAGHAIGPPPGRIFPGIVGGMAVLMGTGSLWMGLGSGMRFPAVLGGTALILGLVLLFRPQSARSDANPLFDSTLPDFRGKNRRN